MKKNPAIRFSLTFYLISALAVLIASAALIPILILSREEVEFPSVEPEPFPVTVDPIQKRITESEQVEALLLDGNLSLTSAALNAGDFFYDAAASIASAPWYQLIAAGAGPRIVKIEPGYRREEVALVVGQALNWNKTTRDAFLKETASGADALPEGRFVPGLYAIETGMTTSDLSGMFRARFERKVASRYSTTTEAVVPLRDALTIASMIQREAGSTDEMRVISGIIWNRIFTGMRLQVDATLQYAKATGRSGWWPVVRSRDKYIRSPYNTYQNNGLPPGPIASPSIAAVIAALNPKNTSCHYYFHDSKGEFHCSDTYEGHVALLKKFYGRGK